jgi:hypothetical protein
MEFEENIEEFEGNLTRNLKNRGNFLLGNLKNKEQNKERIMFESKNSTL